MGMIFMVDSICIIENNIADTEGVEIVIPDGLLAVRSQINPRQALLQLTCESIDIFHDSWTSNLSLKTIGEIGMSHFALCSFQ